MKNGKVPNTDSPVNGKRPGEQHYQFCKQREICTSCHTRWRDEDSLTCALCESKRVARAEVAKRRNNPLLKDKRQPLWIEVVLVRQLRSNKYAAEIRSDMGTLDRFTNLKAIDVRDASKGKVKMTSFRAETDEPTERKLIKMARKRVATRKPAASARDTATTA